MNRFEELIAPHLDAAYNLARWITGSDSAARDVVQESALRHWVAFDDEIEKNEGALSHSQTPELLAIHTENAALLQQALSALPPAFREVIVLKELENLPYKDIALVVDIPIGTVMSRLARARAMLKLELLKLYDHE